ncbi:MAG TPA: hypothetical protein PLF81_11335 [Candidatus Anammoximicrobium sp.]|nr:hypothetical protein [Candidatus Anammoximicrobium sp.]
MSHLDCCKSAAALLVGWSLVFAGCGVGDIPAPTEFKTWDAKEGAFRVLYPADWEAAGGGKQGTQWAKFTKGGAMIKVGVGVAGSLIGDIASGGLASANVAGDETGLTKEQQEALAPVTRVHELRKEEMAQEYGDYQETTASNISCKLGPARKGEFTAAGGFGGKLHGYHVTILGHNLRVSVVCTCPESNWAVLQPAFDKIIGELDSSPSR